MEQTDILFEMMYDREKRQILIFDKAQMEKKNFDSMTQMSCWANWQISVSYIVRLFCN